MDQNNNRNHPLEEDWAEEFLASPELIYELAMENSQLAQEEADQELPQEESPQPSAPEMAEAPAGEIFEDILPEAAAGSDGEIFAEITPVFQSAGDLDAPVMEELPPVFQPAGDLSEDAPQQNEQAQTEEDDLPVILPAQAPAAPETAPEFPELGEEMAQDAPELGMDELAVAGLIHPADAELERIIEETKAADWEDAPAAAPVSEPAPQQAPAAQGPEPTDPPLEEILAEFQPEQSSQGIYDGETMVVPPVPGHSNQSFPQDTQYFQVPAQTPVQQPQQTAKAAKKQAKVPAEQKPARKRRPQRKGGYGLFGIPHIISTLIWLGIITAIGVTLGRLVWVAASDMLAFNKPFISATITITADDSLDDIVEELEDAGLVRYPVLFKAFAQLKGGREDISNGTFTFTNDRLYDYNAIMNNINPSSPGREEITDLVIPEGYTCAQIFKLLEDKGVCTVAELEEYCANGEIKDYWFLEGIERGDKYCLEGYLFPNTYDFYKDDSAAHVINKMLQSFDDNYTDIMKEKLEPLNQRMATVLANRGFSQEYINAHKFTVHDIVIIASMIERESTGGIERFKVSGVIFNRLTNPNQFPRLEIDATILYALGGNIDPETGKVKPLTREDLQMDHPYNSYKNNGLIPGPISNPGAASLNAALDPDDEGYYFYVYDPDAGVHIFSKTREEHERAVASVRD